ncbi:hypothetical protein [Actinomycetospora lemnae]|uniref:Syndecan 1 n=1 Tax=Actinomycetospora lemnae TaxID=3019891 RepID=A0ABT5SUK3_9PSEU|nr:hypothetical protein [Actinomycetospora sp. DW7H6]MDD7966521.1 hypothetical protein [Actinomycetospora sp. DW7H6]
MAERDMTGEDRPGAEPAPGLARRRAQDPPRIGRLGFGDLGELPDLGGLAGGGGDLANLPPWSVRDERANGASGTERPDRDPVALAAWRRVAERRRQRAAGLGGTSVGEATPAGGDAAVPDQPSSAEPVAPGPPEPDEPVVAEPAGAASAEPAVAEPEPTAAEPVDPVAAVPDEVEDVAEDVAEDRPDDPVAAEPARVEEEPAPEAAVEPAAARDVEPVDEPVVPRASGPGDDPRPEPAAAREPGRAEASAPEPRHEPVASRDLGPADEDDLAPWFGSRIVEPEARDAGAGPGRRPPGARNARSGLDPRPGGTPTEGGSRHEVLLSLAGRIDDDALTSVRELVAVEDEAAAAELLGGCLLAAGAGVTAREHAVLGRWFAASRVDPELVDALPRDPDADRREDHRFTADPPPGATAGGAGEAVARAAARLPGVQRVRQCWRTTPAGTAPGPVPHRVVLVETHSPDDCEHVAHHVAYAAREHGAVSVEVFAAGAELPAYHRAAVRAARPLGTPQTVPAASTPAPARSSAPGPAPRSRPAVDLRPEAAPWRRPADEVPPFGVPAAPREEPDEPVEEEYRTVAAAGTDPLERADRTDPAPDARLPRRTIEAREPVREAPREPVRETPREPGPVSESDVAREALREMARSMPPEPEPAPPPADTAGAPDRPAATPRPEQAERPEAPRPARPEPETRHVGPEPESREDEPEPETVAPEAPAPVDIDPDATAERIAALWRTPPPDEILSDQHPISSWTEGPVGVTFGPDQDDPAEPPRSADVPAWRTEAPVDPDAATGDLPVVGPAPTTPPPTPPAAPDNGSSNGRVRRARHSRSETGELEVPPEAAEYSAEYTAEYPGGRPTGTSSTNGHHHGPEADGHDAARAEPATGPVQHPGGPEPTAPAAAQAPSPTPPASSGPDSFDVQLSERERELLARLHEELASRERLAADAPDPLLGRPPQQPPPPPGSEDTTAPRPRPTGPHPGPGRPGRPGGPGPWQGPPPGVAGTNGAGTNGHPHGPVNGHGLPRRGDHDDQDGPPRDA